MADSAGTPIDDLWQGVTNGKFNYGWVTVPAGGSVTVNVTITPSAATGTVIAGTLYVDTVLAGVPPYSQFTGDEVTALPYEYKVG